MGSTDTPPMSAWRKYLPDLKSPRFEAMKQQDAHVYAAEFKEKGNPPWLFALWQLWRRLFAEPYKGITSDGTIRTDLFHQQDEGVPTARISDLTKNLLSMISKEQRDRLCYHIDSPEWRTWSNPEFLLSDKGLRLDEVTEPIRIAILAILEATISPEGYQKAISAMRINGFLGQLADCPRICNEFSYNFVLFGQPSASSPFGFSFYGHHLCLNILLYGSQIVLSPWFTGAEPNEIDDGPYAGTKILRVEEKLGLELMQSLQPATQAKAQTYKLMKDPAMPKGRWNHDDQRHLCGAYRDNRIVPYEGVLVSSLTGPQQSLISEILAEYFLYLPQQARSLRLRQAQQYFSETYFSWIGEYESADSVFYYRIQSPVVIVEFDHHSGVFLSNEEPKRFHTHTLLRTPNAGDYGVALRRVGRGEGEVKQDWVWEG
jgi:Protein of unknown function (DUF3500)